EGDGAAGGNADGTGSGDGSGDGDSTGAGSGTGTGAGTGVGDGTGGGSSGGPLARTGAEILVPLGVAVALLLGGGALVALRRRRGPHAPRRRSTAVSRLMAGRTSTGRCGPPLRGAATPRDPPRLLDSAPISLHSSWRTELFLSRAPGVRTPPGRSSQTD